MFFVKSYGPWETPCVNPNVKVDRVPPKMPEHCNYVAKDSSDFVPLGFSATIFQHCANVMLGIGPRITQLCIVQFGVVRAYLDPKQC